jgi:Tfp pilus assembly protein PilO
MRTLSERESRLLAVLLLVAAISLVMLVLVNPVIDGFRERAALRERLGQEFRVNEQRIASLNSLEHEALQQQDAMRARFITGPDADEAGETLREKIEATAIASGANVKATEAIPSTDDAWVRVALEAQLSHAQFATLLARLNQQEPAVVVETVVVSASEALNDPKSDLLNVRLEASAPFIRAR